MRRLNKLDFPTLGKPTHPILRFFLTRPKATTLDFTSSVATFLGGMLSDFLLKPGGLNSEVE